MKKPQTQTKTASLIPILTVTFTAIAMAILTITILSIINNNHIRSSYNPSEVALASLHQAVINEDSDSEHQPDCVCCC